MQPLEEVTSVNVVTFEEVFGVLWLSLILWAKGGARVRVGLVGA